MKRKVAQVGPSTLMVSLPIKWVREYGIRKGDEVEVMEEGGKLWVGTALKKTSKEITVTIPTVKEYLGRFITAPYVKGYDKIIVKFNEGKVYDKVSETSQLLLGFEIIESTAESCTLLNVSTTLEQNFDILLNRLFMSNLVFGKELLGRLRNKAELDGLRGYENNINKIALFCKRVLQTQSIQRGAYSTASLYHMIAHLEEAADSFRRIVLQVNPKDTILLKKTSDLFEKCIKMQEINFMIFNRSLKGEATTSLIPLFREHKAIHTSIDYHNYYSKDATNSFICGELMNAINLSFHISEELFR